MGIMEEITELVKKNAAKRSAKGVEVRGNARWLRRKDRGEPLMIYVIGVASSGRESLTGRALKLIEIARI